MSLEYPIWISTSTRDEIGVENSMHCIRNYRFTTKTTELGNHKVIRNLAFNSKGSYCCNHSKNCHYDAVEGQYIDMDYMIHWVVDPSENIIKTHTGNSEIQGSQKQHIIGPQK